MMARAAVVAQGSKQGRALFETQGLRAGRRLHSGLGQGGAQMTFRVVGFEIIPQGFTLLPKRELEEINEPIFDAAIENAAIDLEARFFLPRRQGERQCGGMNFWRRGKGSELRSES